MTGSIPTRPTLVCQSLAKMAGSLWGPIGGLGLPFTKNWPVTPSTSGEDARWIELPHDPAVTCSVTLGL
jgi:hypothetical protein